jgi:hypothetical protein
MEERAAGFWSRFAAWWIDATIIFGVVSVIAGVARHRGIYMPFELTFVLLMAAQERDSIGFDVADSPSKLLSAGQSGQTGVCLTDVAPGIIYIKSSGDVIERSKRIPGFITEEMFLQHKPYYEVIAGRPLKTAQEANGYTK